MHSAEIIKRAAQLIETHGWIKHRMSSDDGYCTLGALNATAGCDEALPDAPTARPVGAAYDSRHFVRVALAALYTEDHLMVESLTYWNDRVAKSKDEVLAVLDLAAFLAEQVEDE